MYCHGKCIQSSTLLIFYLHNGYQNIFPRSYYYSPYAFDTLILREALVVGIRIVNLLHVILYKVYSARHQPVEGAILLWDLVFVYTCIN
jgi:uncharacterized membrane protein YagU involved in acid resistance